MLFVILCKGVLPNSQIYGKILNFSFGKMFKLIDHNFQHDCSIYMG